MKINFAQGFSCVLSPLHDELATNAEKVNLPTNLPMSPESDTESPRGCYAQFKPIQRDGGSMSNTEYLTHFLIFVFLFVYL